MTLPRVSRSKRTIVSQKTSLMCAATALGVVFSHLVCVGGLLIVGGSPPIAAVWAVPCVSSYRVVLTWFLFAAGGSAMKLSDV